MNVPIRCNDWGEGNIGWWVFLRYDPMGQPNFRQKFTQGRVCHEKAACQNVEPVLGVYFFNSDPWSCEWRNAATGAGQAE
jgi:hypothetical protein